MDAIRRDRRLTSERELQTNPWVPRSTGGRFSRTDASLPVPTDPERSSFRAILIAAHGSTIVTTTPTSKPRRKWWVPRFSLRFLAFVVAIVATYFAGWAVTKRAADRIGLPERPNVVQASSSRGTVMLLVPRVECPAPLIMSEIRWDSDDTVPPIGMQRRYYLWFFGPRFELPFRSRFTPPADVPEATNDDLDMIHRTKRWLQTS